MLSIRIWSPDTCGCVIHLVGEQDEKGWRMLDEPYVTWEEAQIIHENFKKLVPTANPNPQPPARVCDAHKDHGATKKMCDHVRDENSRKNIALGTVLDNVPNLKIEDIAWSFDIDRKLHLGFPSSVQDKTRVRTRLLAHFNTDLAVID